MSIIKLFLGSSQETTGRGLDAETDASVTDALENGLVDKFKKLNPPPNALLNNGETVMTYAVKLRKERQDACAEACRRFERNDGGFHARIEKIESITYNLPNRMTALGQCALLSSERFLMKMNVPRDQWPDIVIGDDFFDAQDRHAQSIVETFGAYAAAENIIRHYAGNREPRQANEMGETPEELIGIFSDEQRRNSSTIDRAGRITTAAAHLRDSLAKRVDARLFIAMAINPAMQGHFTWLKTFRPTEESFMNVFKPGWRDDFTNDIVQKTGDAVLRDAAALKDALRVRQVEYLNDIGYYEWQPSESAQRILAKLREIEIQKTFHELKEGQPPAKQGGASA